VPLSGSWWANVVRKVALTQVNTYEECVLGRILRSFDTLHDEVQAKSDALFGAMELPPDENPDSAAKWATDKALDWGADVGAVYMGTVALLTVGLYHLFEQHREMFARLARDFEARGARNFEEFLRTSGIEASGFPEWTKLNEELRFVANVVKHAEGWSAEELRKRRPDLFVLPSNRM
jgi:hypothetical protein